MKIARPKIKKSPEQNFERLVAQESLILEVTEEICRVLDAAKISRQELANRLGKSKGFVTQVLSGERNMTLRTAADLASALDHHLQVKAVPAGRSIPAATVPLYIPLHHGHTLGKQRAGTPPLGVVASDWNEVARRAAEGRIKDQLTRHERWSPATQAVECDEAPKVSPPDHEFLLSA